MAPARDQDLPLTGLRVLELSHTVMGPTAGLVLADLGADVVKVEPAPEGDATRRLPGFGIGFFGYLNRNKRSFVVDLKTEEGRGLVHRLAAGAGAPRRLGDLPDVRERRRRAAVPRHHQQPALPRVLRGIRAG
jgi:crotonobetainyl-CoA:carnitine CoA-transferase CaiB-like acyl-CoA transferase